MVEIQTRDFGKLEIDESKIFEFPNGVFAFEECRHFALISPLGEDVYPMWLQCTDSVTPCFIVFDPMLIDGKYQLELTNSEKQMLKANGDTKLRTLAIAVVPDDYKQTTVNMKSPIVINTDENLAAQIILPEKYDIRFHIYAGKGAD